MYEPHRPTASDAEKLRSSLIVGLSRGRNTSWLHPNFYYSHIYPIGITWSHAFVMSYVKEDRAHYLHALSIHASFDTPYRAMRERRQFSNPWRRWPGKFNHIQAVCCYLGRVCVITKNQLLVLDAAKDWEIVVKFSSRDFKTLQGCSMNHKQLAFYSNNPETRTSRICVFSIDSKNIAQTNINNVRVTGMHVPEELTGFTSRDLYVGFDKLDENGQVIGTPTCVFYVSEDGLEINMKKRIDAWPVDEQKCPLVTNGPEMIQYRLGSFMQSTDRYLICFFSAGNANNLFLPSSNKVIHAQSVSNSGIVVFQGNNSLLLSDRTSGVNFCIEPTELCGPSSIASFSRFKGVPEYNRCYSAFRVMSDRIVILLPNGSLCSIRPAIRKLTLSATSVDVVDDI